MLAPNDERPGRKAELVEGLAIAVALLAFLALCWAFGAAFGLW
jgi:hypothetical protein